MIYGLKYTIFGSSESDFIYKIVKEVKKVEKAIGLEEEEQFLGKKLRTKVRKFDKRCRMYIRRGVLKSGIGERLGFVRRSSDA